MYEQTKVQNLIVFENYDFLFDALRKFNLDTTLTHYE